MRDLILHFELVAIFLLLCLVFGNEHLLFVGIVRVGGVKVRLFIKTALLVLAVITPVALLVRLVSRVSLRDLAMSLRNKQLKL